MREILIVLASLITLDVQASIYVPVPFDGQFFYPTIAKRLYQIYRVGNDVDLEALLFDPNFDDNPKEYFAKRKRDDDVRGVEIETPFPQQKRMKSSPMTDVVLEIQSSITEPDPAETIVFPKPTFNEIGQIIDPPSEADMGGLTIDQKSNVLKIADFTWREKGGINTANVKLQWIFIYECFGVTREVTEKSLRTKATILKMDQKFLKDFFEAEGVLSLQDTIAKPIFDEARKILYPPSEVDVDGLTVEQKSNILNEGFALSYADKRQSYKRTPKLNDKELPWILFYLYKSKNRIDISRYVNIHPDRFSRIYGCLKAVVPDLQAIWDKTK